MSFTIRQTEAQDREALIALFQALNTHENAITGDRRSDRSGAEESLAESQAQVERSEGVFLVAESAGKVVGLVTLTFEEGPVYLQVEARPYAHIGDLVVAESERQKGIGRALMTAAEEHAASRGYRQVTVGVLVGNKSAEAAYARQGFQPLGLNLVKAVGPD